MTGETRGIAYQEKRKYRGGLGREGTYGQLKEVQELKRLLTKETKGRKDGKGRTRAR